MAFDEKKVEGAYSADIQNASVRALAQAGRDQTIFQPEWLPDGEQIVFYRRDKTAHPSHVIVRNVDTGAERELETGQDAAGFIDTAISPDGRQLAFRAAAALGIVPIAGGAPLELFRSNATGGRLNFLGWSPDSLHLIFETTQRMGLRNVNREVWRIPAGGGERTKLASDQFQAEKFQFHPDGRRIAYSATEGGGMEIWALENLLPK
ncbi:MAG TPA: hypothetical protein VL285_03310, partial [Bryobacteraceae bacterium]|nr:hypothetical protein [Bryobacteraceae bacterium]